MPYAFQPEIDLQHARTLWSCLHDNNPIRILIGPVGSGKTTYCAAEVYSRALQQAPSPDGIRRFKAMVVRNTMPELKRTTIQTWTSIFPEEATAPIRWSSPAEHHIQHRAQDFKWNDDGTWEGEPGLDLLVEFVALDTPKDVKRLLSWEGTMIWFNEVREIPRAIIDMADMRVGRYPSVVQGGVEPTWYGVIGDTNPPDEDHWIYAADQGIDEYGEFIGRPEGWSFYFQPPGLVEMKKGEDGVWASADGQTVQIEVTNEDHIHQAAGTHWAVNPDAENLPNLPLHRGLDPTGDPLGKGGYYARGMQGRTKDWIICYLQGRYQFVKEGKAVVEEFNSDMMVVDDLPILDNADCFVGGDIGGNTLNPAAILFQKGPRGIWLVHAEVSAEGMGLDRYETEVRALWSRTYGERHCKAFYGDPAGRVRDGIFETIAFDHLISKGWPAMPAPTQVINVRIDAIKAPMGRLIDGKPGILIDRRCVKLIKALGGAWHYRRMQQGGRAKYAETPEKNHPYSDLADALGYGLSGAGETKMVQRGQGPGDPTMVGPKVPPARVGPSGVFVANTDFDVFNS